MKHPCLHCGELLSIDVRNCVCGFENPKYSAAPQEVTHGQSSIAPIVAKNLKDKLFCEIAISLGYITHDQAAQALRQQNVDEAIGTKKPIGAYLHDQNWLSREQIAQIVTMQDTMERAGSTIASNQSSQTPGPSSQSRTSRSLYVVLGLILGCFGMHNFVAGYFGRGVAQLLISLVFGWVYGLGFFITAFWAVIEVIAVKADAKGVPFS